MNPGSKRVSTNSDPGFIVSSSSPQRVRKSLSRAYTVGMPRASSASWITFFCVLVCSVGAALAQRRQIELTVNDENGVAVPEAQVVVSETGLAPQRLTTNYAGRCQYGIHGNASYVVD